MQPPSTTSRLISAYGEQVRGSESWKIDHQEAMRSYEIENILDWGIRIFETLADIESRLQSRWAGSWPEEAQIAQDELDANYRMWLKASRGYLAMADDLIAQHYEIARVEEFRLAILESECFVEIAELEPGLPTIQETAKYVRPDNPRPGRYGD